MSLSKNRLKITLERCDDIIQACDESGVRLCAIFNSRFTEGSQLVKRTIDSGRFGVITLGDAYIKWFRTQEYYDSGGWRGTWALDGGGALMNQSIHAIDLLQYFMGPVKAVQAFTDMMTHERIEVEDVAVAALRFENGALGVIEGTTTVYPGLLKKLEISGNKGTVTLEDEDIIRWEFDPELPEDVETRERFAQTRSGGGGAADPRAISHENHQPANAKLHQRHRKRDTASRRWPRRSQSGRDYPRHLQIQPRRTAGRTATLILAQPTTDHKETEFFLQNSVSLFGTSVGWTPHTSLTSLMDSSPLPWRLYPTPVRSRISVNTVCPIIAVIGQSA